MERLPAVSGLGADAVGVVHRIQQLAARVVVALDGSGGPGEVLGTVGRRLPGGRAGDLPREDIPRLRRRCRPVGDGQFYRVRARCPKLHIH